jgi:hypothetical protein
VGELTVEDALVAELARAAVTQAAPEELPLFPATSEAYFDDPDSLDRGGGKDELLGFGVEAALVLVTPVALSVARDVLNFVIEQVRGHARAAGTDAIDRLADRVLGRGGEKAAEPTAAAEPGAGDPPEPELTDEQLEQVRALAVEKARLLKLPPEKARLLADSLVGSLAIA